MCRHLGYLGPAVGVGEMLTRGSHSLRTQAWAPRDMRGGGTINADGFGVAWWRSAATGAGGAEPIVSRYRNAAPIWTDPAVEEVLPQLRSTAVLGAIRSATVGMPIERAACAPFTAERWAFSHNGKVADWRRVLTAASSDLDVAATRFGATRLLETAQLLDAEAPTDAATLWVLMRQLLAGAQPGGFVETPAAALGLLVAAVLRHAPDARLNLLLCDGETLWASTVYHSLSALVTDTAAVLSSEPYDDDPNWQSIPDRSLVTARPGHLSITSMPDGTKGLSR
ncbi:ergothioneine biosynthesis protein EgtC [Nocardia brasiliensis]|uniref:Gamma-glutamyl-hercynylcysteine sulfoxide hydrolase n=1 Tax=Nocardia brasiliensis TaxID=37326 RepID=A0A6G9XZD6_NOCBR|nr:ergothioneine biosynthesis protein EgtC [Nocardia brasiliensis]QIS06183.1 ergothioneine biosynthesis protein EgtC [Nocardia brasiliensis]